jgi:cold shock CspA family protein
MILAKPIRSGERATGRIKLLVRSRNSGLIRAEAGEVFFHRSEVEGAFGDLKVGDRVVFELLEDAISGPRAQHVRVVRSPVDS